MSVGSIEVAPSIPETTQQRAPRERGGSVFIMVESFNIGGSESQAVELARQLHGREWPVILGCLRAKGPLLERLVGTGIEVVEFDPGATLMGIGGIKQAIALAKFLHKRKIDIVQTFDLYSNLLGVPAARLAGVPVILSARRDFGQWSWYTPSRRKILNRIQKLSTLVVANSEAVRESMIAEDRFDAASVVTLRNAVQDPLGRDLQGGLPAECAPGDKLIAFVGNMHSRIKGHDMLLAVAPAVLQRVKNVRFLLAGDGAERPRLEAAVRELGLQREILFLGQCKDVSALLSRCAAGILLSDSEGMPNAILEYMVAGLPTIATITGGVPELVEHKVTGLLVVQGDIRGLEEALVELSNDDVMRARMGAAARARALSEFSFDRMLQEVTELYRKTLAQRRSSSKGPA